MRPRWRRSPRPLRGLPCWPAALLPAHECRACLLETRASSLLEVKLLQWRPTNWQAASACTWSAASWQGCISHQMCAPAAAGCSTVASYASGTHMVTSRIDLRWHPPYVAAVGWQRACPSNARVLLQWLPPIAVAADHSQGLWIMLQCHRAACHAMHSRGQQLDRNAVANWQLLQCKLAHNGELLHSLGKTHDTTSNT